MLLIRRSGQQQETARERYEDLLREDEVSARIGRGMLALLDELAKRCPHRTVWCHTSLHWLCLLPDDGAMSAPVRVIGLGEEYVIEYRRAGPAGPATGDKVREEVRGAALAADHVELAMTVSGAWA